MAGQWSAEAAARKISDPLRLPVPAKARFRVAQGRAPWRRHGETSRPPPGTRANPVRPTWPGPRPGRKKPGHAVNRSAGGRR